MVCSLHSQPLCLSTNTFLERFLEGQLAEHYRWLLSHFPVVRRVWTVDPMMTADEDEIIPTAKYLALFLLNSRDFEITESDFCAYFNEVVLHLIPLVQNGVLGDGKCL